MCFRLLALSGYDVWFCFDGWLASEGLLDLKGMHVVTINSCLNIFASVFTNFCLRQLAGLLSFELVMSERASIFVYLS